MGGEIVQCFNMTSEGRFDFTVPRVEIPVLFRFRDQETQVEPNLDTLIVEPDQRRCILVWRATIAVGRKLNNLREVFLGRQPRPRLEPTDKQHFKSLAEFIAWKKRTSVT
jgi:hypothetical protein